MKRPSIFAAAKDIIARPLGLHVPRGTLKVFDDDLFLVSYPRSGNTWARFLIGDLTSRAQCVDFINVEQIVPDIYRNREFERRSIPRPRVLKSHERYDPRYKRVIYLVRDPRDVLVSYYNYQIMMGYIDSATQLDGYAQSFLRGDVPFGSWQQHVESWVGASEEGMEFLMIRYEDLLREPLKYLALVTQFLGMHRSRSAMSAVVDRYTSDKMRELEKQQGRHWKSLKDKRDDGLFVRAATTGQWRKALPPSLVKQIEVTWRPTMERLGYLGITKISAAGTRVCSERPVGNNSRSRPSRIPAAGQTVVGRANDLLERRRSLLKETT